MSRDGSGNYSLPSGNPVVNGTVIDATVHNNTNSDIATALSASLCADGQKTATANQPMGTFKHTNIGDAAARNQYASAGQVQDGSLLTLSTVSGTDTITGALIPAITSYVTRMLVTFTPTNNNTGAATIAINGLSSKSIVKGNAAALVAGDLVTTCPAVLVYDGTAFVLFNPQHNVADGEVTLARMANLAQDQFIVRTTASTGVPQTATCTAAGRALIDDADAAAQRTTLGLGTAATSASSAFAAASHTHGNSDLTGYTAADVLAKLVTVDGSGSGLDADLLDGQSSAFYQNAGNFNAGTIPDARISASNVTQFQDPTNNVGYLTIPQNSQSTNYTLLIGDAGKNIYHASGAGSGDTYTIPANASVAFPVGTAITFINSDSNNVSIAITADTLTLAGSTNTGTRTLAQNGIATAVKVTTTSWLIGGTGLT